MEEVAGVVDHTLDDLLQVLGDHGHLLEGCELGSEQRGPPTDGQVLTVHAVLRRVLRHSETRLNTNVRIPGLQYWERC